MLNYPIVSIIILNWNAFEMTSRCLTTLCNITDYPAEKMHVIVVDNGSTDGSPENIKEYFPDIDCIALKTNLGFILGNNYAITYSIRQYNPDYLLLLNNDVIVSEKNWLRELVSTAERNHKIGIIGPKLLFPDGRVQWCGHPKKSNMISLMFQTISVGRNPGIGKLNSSANESEYIGLVNTISGACMLINVELIKKMGLLDEALLPMFGEDVEYCFRAYVNGYDVFYRGDIYLIHYQSYTVEKYANDLELKKVFWVVKNGIIISKAYFGFINTLIFGMPIFISTLLLEKKNKTHGISISNIKLGHNFLARLYLIPEVTKYLFQKKRS